MLTMFLQSFRDASEPEMIPGAEAFVAYVRGQLAADPIRSFNPGTGELTRRSGGVLPLPGYDTGMGEQPPYLTVGPVHNQGAGIGLGAQAVGVFPRG